MSHPEDFCQRCGRPNPGSWVVDSDRFNAAMAALARDSSAIVCPPCFILGHELATGMTTSWRLTPATPFRPMET